jgi:hypothetical protein
MPLNSIQKIQRRAKQAERDVGHWMLEHDGPDPIWSRVASSTGRTGHITQLQMDVVSLHYATEVKNIKMSAKLLGFWQQIQDIAAKQGKDACLVIQPSNPLPRREGMPKRFNTWHVITEERHAELLEAERNAKSKMPLSNK